MDLGELENSIKYVHPISEHEYIRNIYDSYRKNKKQQNNSSEYQYNSFVTTRSCLSDNILISQILEEIEV